MVMQKGALFEKLDVNGGGGGGSVDYNRVVEKTAAELPTPTAELAGKAYMYVGATDNDKNLRNGGIYECAEGVVPASISTSFVSQTISNVVINNTEQFASAMGWTADTTVTLTAAENLVEKPSQSDGYEPNTGIHWYITNNSAFVEEMHTLFPTIDFYDPALSTPGIGIQFMSWNDPAWSVTIQRDGTDLGTATITSLEQVFINIDEPIPEGTAYFGIWGITLVKELEFSWSDGSGNTYTPAWLESAGLSISGEASAGDTITISYTVPARGYVWKPADLKYLVMPSLLEYTNDVVQYLGWDNDTYKKGHFYKCVNNGDIPAEYTIQQTEGTTLSGLGMGSEPWKFGEQLGWPSEEKDVRFVYMGQAAIDGTITYNFSNIEATLDLATFWSKWLSEGGDENINRTFRLVYEDNGFGDGWFIHTIYPDDWDQIDKSFVYPAEWGLTITSGTPVAGSDGVDIVITTLPGDQWDEYVDGVLFKSTPATSWGIVYEGTPTAGVELEGHFTPGHENFAWVEAEVQSASSSVVTLAAANWNNDEQTVLVPVEDIQSKVVFVSPTPSSTSDYVAAGILCVEQVYGGLKFTCTSAPSNDIDVNVVVL